MSKTAKFLDAIRAVFNSVAKQILESQTMAPTKKNIALSNLASNSSSQSVMIPCGILLSLVSFLHIASIYPSIQLVFETYNGKMKGLSVPVKIDKNGEPDLPQASLDLMESCVRTDSLFSILSKLIRKGIVRMKPDSSSFGFGFRAIFTKKTDNKLVLAAVNPKTSTDSRQVQLWPLAYLDADTCPNLISFNNAKLNLEEVKEFIEKQTPETKIYLGCDSERLRVDGVWYADYILAIVVHIDGKHGCKLFGEVIREKDFDKMSKERSEKVGLKLVGKSEHKHFKPVYATEQLSEYKQATTLLQEGSYKEYKTDDSRSSNRKINDSIKNINRTTT